MSLNSNAYWPASAWDGSTVRANTQNHGESPGPMDWDQLVAEVMNLENFLIGADGSAGVAGTNVAAAETGIPMRKTTLTVSGTITMTDATTAGCHGSRKIYDFPLGVIKIHSVKTDVHLVAGAGGIADDAAAVAALGSATVGTGDATLTTTEADIVASTAATLTTGEGDMDAIGNGVTLDGRSTAADCFLNIAVPDADSSASDTFTISGTINIVWSLVA